LVTSFIAFRLFDIWKPGPVGWADRKHGPLGVMLDDLIAGVMAAVVVVALAVLAHEVFIR
jgi:phosphatidylglycerophosphatase A